MPPTTITNAERFVVEGPLGPPILIAIGLILTLLFAWTLRRESHVLGTRNAAMFWCLRTVAAMCQSFCGCCWPPTKVLVETSTTRKAIVIATDVSGSMQTVDPAGTSDEFRWMLARSNAESFSQTREADEAVAAMGIALRQLQIARDALQKHGQERPIVDSVGAANAALQSVREHLQRIATGAPSHRYSEKTLSLVNRLLKLFDGAELQSFERLSQAIQKNRTPSQKGWQESLPDLEHRIVAIKTVMLELARTAAVDESRQLRGQDVELLGAVQGASRLDRVSKSVGQIQATSLAALREKADVRFSSFDRAMHWQSGPAGDHCHIRPDP